MAHLSFHVGKEGKIKKADIKKMTGHTFRKTEGRYKNHKNEEIDKDKTKNNYDWTLGNEPLEKIVEDRLKNEFKGKRNLRKDAVVIREIIIQASTDIYEGLSEEEKRVKSAHFTADSLEWLQEEFGERNVVGFSMHLDETNPHTHIAIMPLTADGRISQKDFFKGPSDLKRQHADYRKHMNERGWDFDLENKYENVDGVALHKYKSNAKEIEKLRQEQKEMMDSLMSDPYIQEEARQNVEGLIFDGILAERIAELDEKEEANKKKAKQLEDKEIALREEKAQLKEECLDLRFKKDFKGAVLEQEPKTYNKNELSAILENTTDGAFRIAKLRDGSLTYADARGDKLKVTDLKTIVEDVYKMDGSDVIVDAQYQATQDLSLVASHIKHKNLPMSDSMAINMGFDIVAEAVNERQKEFEKEQAL